MWENLCRVCHCVKGNCACGASNIITIASTETKITLLADVDGLERQLIEAAEMLHEVKRYRGIFYRQRVAEWQKATNQLLNTVTCKCGEEYDKSKWGTCPNCDTGLR